MGAEKLICGKMVPKIRPLQIVLALALVIVATSQEDVAETAAESEVNDRAERDLRAIKAEGKNAEGRLLGSVRTTTLWAISVSTSTQFLSCLSGTATTTACNGKRRRRKSLSIEHVGDDTKTLSGSIAPQPGVHEVLESDRSGKLYGFTVWTAVTQSTTVTVFSTNDATTVTLSFYCSNALASMPSLSCG